MTRNRVLLGLAVCIGILSASDWLLGAFDYPIHPTVRAFAVPFLGTSVGGFIARRGFFLPALAVWAVVWSVVVYVLYRIAEPAGPVSVAGILFGNAISLSLSAVALVSGVAAGQTLARRPATVRAPVAP